MIHELFTQVSPQIDTVVIEDFARTIVGLPVLFGKQRIGAVISARYNSSGVLTMLVEGDHDTPLGFSAVILTPLAWFGENGELKRVLAIEVSPVEG